MCFAQRAPAGSRMPFAGIKIDLRVWRNGFGAPYGGVPYYYSLTSK